MKRLFWIDLEMTGLDEKVDHILEVAIVITDINFNPLEEYHRVVFQPPEVLAKMGDWVRNLHAKSGLTALIPSGAAETAVEDDVLALIGRHFDAQTKVVLAGNSVGNDKRFIDRYWSRVAQRLHYRLVDVSSFKEIFRDKYNLTFQKKNAHRAVDDIHESIRELNFYLSYFKTPQEQ